MKRFAMAVGVTALVLAAEGALAQGVGGKLDHLVCYRMKDPLKLQAVTDLIAELQPEFSQKGCLILKPVKFCVPATKRLSAPGAAPNRNIVGPALSNDYICYKARCKTPVPPPDRLVFDQFGARLHEKYQLTEICVPAAKRSARCGFYDKACKGACPDARLECRKIKSAGQVLCDCVPKEKPCGGKPDAGGLCSGLCPDPTEVCRLSYVQPSDPNDKPQLTCNCQRPQQTCGLDPATGQCGGPCPNATDRCVKNADGKCTCEPSNPPCHQTGVDAAGLPICGGTCPPVAGSVPQCTYDPITGSCSCDPKPGCARDPVTGLCGGDCPPGLHCLLNADGICDCQERPCGSDDTGTGAACSGLCPAGENCIADATGACNCRPPDHDPCVTTDGNSVCSPPCPTGQSCSIVPGTNVCRCQ